MAAFKAGEVDVLVATTVIEVGVDVPNATLMVIDNAERLGLAQLHQLRGRVGRGRGASICVLLYEPPLSHVARERLRVLRETNDGFVIAERDLELRGPGDLLGTRQTGEQTFKLVPILATAYAPNSRGQYRQPSRAFTSRFKLTPSSAAAIASERCISGGTRTTNLPLYLRSANGAGACSPLVPMSSRTSRTKARMPASASAWEAARKLSEGNSAHRPTCS